MPRNVRCLMFGRNHVEIDLQRSFYELLRRVKHSSTYMPPSRRSASTATRPVDSALEASHPRTIKQLPLRIINSTVRPRLHIMQHSFQVLQSQPPELYWINYIFFGITLLLLWYSLGCPLQKVLGPLNCRFRRLTQTKPRGVLIRFNQFSLVGALKLRRRESKPQLQRLHDTHKAKYSKTQNETFEIQILHLSQTQTKIQFTSFTCSVNCKTTPRHLTYKVWHPNMQT